MQHHGTRYPYHHSGFVHPISDVSVSTLQTQVPVMGAHVESGRLLANDKQSAQAQSVQIGFSGDCQHELGARSHCVSERNRDAAVFCITQQLQLH